MEGRIRRFGLAAVLSLALSSSASCGGDAPSVVAGSSTWQGGGSAVDFCSVNEAMEAAFGQSGTGPRPEDIKESYAQLQLGFNELLKAAPTEIRGDVATLADAYAAVIRAAEKHGYDPAKFSADPNYRAATKVFETDGPVKSAGENIGAYVERVCTPSRPPSTPVASRPPISLPPGQPDWQRGTELARVALESGVTLRLVETVDGNYVCFVRERDNSVGASCSGVPPIGVNVETLQVLPVGGGRDGWHYIVVLPKGFAENFTLRDQTGTAMAYARASDGRFVVTTEPDVRPGVSSRPAAQSFQFIAADGALLALANIGGPPMRSELLRLQLSSGSTFSVLEDPDNKQVCVMGSLPASPPPSPTGTVTVQGTTACFGYGSAPASSEPSVQPARSPGAFAVYYVVILPVGFPSSISVRDQTGKVLPAARTTDGRAIVIVDPTVTSTTPVARTFEFVGRDGTIAARVEATPPAPR